MNPDFWKRKKVLITGHTGFKGSWLSLLLQMNDAEVIGYALPMQTEPNLFNAAKIADGMVSIIGDVRDFDHLKRELALHQPDVVIHMAAQPLVRYSYAHPIETYSTNIMGTVNVLEAVRQTSNVRATLIITTDKCYENQEWVWGYRENDPMGGYDPYSSSKGCAELVTAAYTKSYFSESNRSANGTSIASARAGNVIGGGDWAEDRLIPDIMRAIMNNDEIVIRNPGAIRPWQHVLDPLNGYLCLIEKLWHEGTKFSGGWNFGPSEESCKPVSYILKNMESIWGKAFSWKHDKDQTLHEANFLKLDCSKARSLLDWCPRLELEAAIKLTLEWYQQFMKNDEIRHVTEKQIIRYEKMER